MTESNQTMHLSKTPTRKTTAMKRMNRPLFPTSSPFRTPIKTITPARHERRSSLSKSQISPSPRVGMTSSVSKRKSNLISRANNGDGGDRFIPNRRRMNVGLCRRLLLSENDDDDDNDEQKRCETGDTANNNKSISKKPTESLIQKEYKRHLLSSMCDIPLEMIDKDARPKSLFKYGNDENFESIRNSALPLNPYSMDHLRVHKNMDIMRNSNVSTNASTIAYMQDRKIPDSPWKILDLPEIVDDFYLNLISWSADNILAVILGADVYLWDANKQKVHLLTTIDRWDGQMGTSVAWCSIPGKTKYLAIGTDANKVQIWDTEALQMVRTFHGHRGRVTALAWNQHWLSSGGQDTYILQRDLRTSCDIVSIYKGHEREVCGLKWNEDGSSLASGGNDDLLCIWDSTMSASTQENGIPGLDRYSMVNPRLVLDDHIAAVKALDWCPFRRNVLASGGGTSDRTIKLWDTCGGDLLSSIDTGSQVCSLLWSKHRSELCSSHGYSENQLVMWKLGRDSSLTKMKDLKQHSKRVLSLACSPDGRTVVSASGDETLCFWDIFGAPAVRRTGRDQTLGDLRFGMPSIR